MHLCSYDCRTLDGSNSLTFESVFQVKLHYHEVSGGFTPQELEFKKRKPKKHPSAEQNRFLASWVSLKQQKMNQLTWGISGGPLQWLLVRFSVFWSWQAIYYPIGSADCALAVRGRSVNSELALDCIHLLHLIIRAGSEEQLQGVEEVLGSKGFVWALPDIQEKIFFKWGDGL